MRCCSKFLSEMCKAILTISGYWIANANFAIAVAKLGDPVRAEKMVRESETHGYKNGKGAREMAGIKNDLGFRLKVLFKGK